MKVILIKNIPKIGKKGEIKQVSDGFANNFLFKQNLALPAMNKNVYKFIKNNKIDDSDEQMEKLKNKLKNINLKLIRTANKQGHLFAGIKIEEIKSILQDKRIEVKNKNIILPSIKSLGKFIVKIKLNNDIEIPINLEIVKKD